MSYPSWLPPKNSGEPVGHVTARMETTHSFGTPSISVSMQQTPKKFAPVVAPKPKYNPYKSGQLEGGDAGDYLPPPPPPLDDFGRLPSPPGVFPPPPAADEAQSSVQVNPGGKTIEERRSSLDAEIDSLTSILADLESSSPYKPRTQQGSSMTSPPGSTPVTGHKRMIIPTQPPLTATKKSTTKPQPQATSQPTPAPVSSTGAMKPQPQPVPASYTTASTPTRPTFNVQVKSAQPSPHFIPSGPQPGPHYNLQPGSQQARPLEPIQYSPSQPRGPDYGYSPPQPDYRYTPPVQNLYQDPAYPAGPGYGARNDSEPAYGPQTAWKPEPAPAYPAASTKKTYITDPVPQAPPSLQPKLS